MYHSILVPYLFTMTHHMTLRSHGFGAAFSGSGGAIVLARRANSAAEMRLSEAEEAEMTSRFESRGYMFVRLRFRERTDPLLIWQ